MYAAGWPIVIVESPFASDMLGNAGYAKRACSDCIKRGEIPFASHVFFPQFLDESSVDQRETGLTAGYAFWKYASYVVFYLDRGWSPGMERALERALERANELGISYLERYLDKEPT